MRGLPDSSVGIDRYGASAPGGRVLEELGINPENVVSRAKAVLGRVAGRAEAGNTIEGTEEDSRRIIERLRTLGIDIEEVCARLEREGVDRFTDSYEKLPSSIDRRLRGASAA